MKNTFSLSEIQKTGDLNPVLITRHCKFDKMAKFMEVKSINPKLKHSQTARELKRSSTLQRYRKEINMLSPYRIPNTHTIQENKSRPTTTPKRPQMISKCPQMTSK